MECQFLNGKKPILKESSSCGQNKLQTSNFKISIPCMHRLELGAELSDILVSTDKYDRIEIKHDFNQNLQIGPKMPKSIHRESILCHTTAYSLII